MCQSWMASAGVQEHIFTILLLYMYTTYLLLLNNQKDKVSMVRTEVSEVRAEMLSVDDDKGSVT